MSILRNIDVGSRLNSWRLTRKFDQVTHRADALFCETCHDPEMAQYMASLPLADLPEVQAALVAPDQPDQRALEDAVRKAVAQDWRRLSPEQVERAVDVYLCCLGRAMLPGAQAGAGVRPAVHVRVDARALGVQG